MADRRATLILELKDMASKGLKSFVDVWALAKSAVDLFGISFGKVAAFVQDSVKEFAESEQAVSRLNNAIKNQGTYTAEYSQALQDNALALSRMTGQSDEAILETQTLLTTFGLAGKELRDTTKSALDLSAGLGVDLRTATLLLGKAWAGETATLARYGLKVDETLQPLEKFESLQRQIEQRFGGRAASDAETYTGKINKLSESWKNLKERIGEDFARSSESTITALDKLAIKVTENYDAIKKYSIATLVGNLTGSGFAGQVQGIIALFKGLEEAQVKAYEAGNAARAKDMAGASNDPKSTNPGIQAEIDAERTKQEEIAELESFGLAESSRKKIESLTLTNDEMERLEIDRLARGLQATGQNEAAKTLTEALYAKQRRDVAMATLNTLATFQNAKNKELAAVGKAAAISITMINAHVAAGQALAAFAKIPPLAIAMASIMYAAGAARAAAIAGVPLAEGGMLMSRSGGVPAIMAEAGHDEVAIPLDDPRTKERLRDTFDGGSGGVHIHVGTLVADDGGLMELARRIDEKLFAMDRRNMRVS